MKEQHRMQVLEMMKSFYASEAVYTNGSEEIFNSDITACINDNPYIEGYVFENDTIIQGYAMVAKSFSTEFGKPCIWIEDLYIKEEHRGLGIGSLFLEFIEAKYPNSLFRLEVESENHAALHVYKKRGYDILPYMEMKKNR
jgi:GNAT superfamily N-acetyltransferase